MLLYTYGTQRPIGPCARSLHVGTPAHMYTVHGRPITSARSRRSLYYRPPPYLSLRPRSDEPSDPAVCSLPLPLHARAIRGPEQLRPNNLASEFFLRPAVCKLAVSSDTVSAFPDIIHASRLGCSNSLRTFSPISNSPSRDYILVQYLFSKTAHGRP